MEKIFKTVVRYPKLVVALSIGFVVLMGLNLPKIGIDPSIKGMLPSDFPANVKLEEFEEIFSASELLLVVVEVDDLMDPETIRGLHDFHDRLAALEDSYRVVSLFTTKFLEADDRSFKPAVLLDRDAPPQNDEERALLRHRLENDDMFVGNLVSADLKSLVFLILPEDDFDDKRLAFTARDLARATYGDRAMITGLPSTRTEVTGGMQGDLKAFLPIGIVLMILLLVLSFKTWLGAILPLMVVIMSVVSTFGFMALIGQKIQMVTLIMPVMLIAVANDYGIHLVAHYLGHVGADPDGDRRAHVHAVAQSLSMPIMAAGLTTVAGFLTLLSHVIPAIRWAGVLSGFGVIVAFVLSLTFIPAMLVLLRPPRKVFDQFTSSVLTRSLKLVVAFLRSHGGKTVVLIFLAGLIAGTGLIWLKVDTDPVHYFHKTSPIRQANEYVNKTFGGSAQLNVVVKGDIKDPEVLRRMEGLQEFLESQKSVSKTQSVADIVKRMNKAFHNDDPAFETIPDSREMVAQFLLLYSFQSDLSDFDHLMDFEYTHAQVAARVNSTSASNILELMAATEKHIANNLDAREFTMVTGFVTILGTLVDIVVQGQLISLSLSLLLVFLIGSIVFRSLIGGLYVSVPLLFAVFCIFGLMGHFKIELNVATAMLASIVVGVGVDYIIHFLWHYRSHLLESGDPWQAVEATMLTSGRGIIVNAVSVVIGFSVLLVSNFLPIFFFGFLLTISISACLIAAMVILPVLVTRRRPAFLSRPAGAASGPVAELPTPSLASAEGSKPMRALFAALLAAALVGIGYFIYLGVVGIIAWHGGLAEGVGFWSGLWQVIVDNFSIAIAIYAVICLNSAGVAEFKFGKPFARAFLTALVVTPPPMMIWARKTREKGK